MEIKAILSGALVVAGRPLTIADFSKLFIEEEYIPTEEELLAELTAISEACSTLGFELKKLASGYRFQVKPEYAGAVSKLWEEKPPKYSKATLEIISIIAYKQPVTRAEIESIRGVAVSTNAIRTLLDRQLIKVIAHKDIPGRPAVYGTTKEFLDYFNLTSINELPALDLSKIAFSKDVVDDQQKVGFDLDDVAAHETAINENEDALDIMGEEVSVVSEQSVALVEEVVESSSEVVVELSDNVIDITAELRESHHDNDELVFAEYQQQ